MFVRRKKNRSGTTGVVVVDKSNGKFRELKTIRQRLVQTVALVKVDTEG